MKGHHIPHSKESKEKMRIAHLGKILSKKHKEKISLSLKGKSKKPFSKEHKQHLSQSHLGKHLSPEHKKKIGFAGLGRTHSQETKQKLRQSHLGKHLNPITKQKLSLINKGKKLSEITKQRISDARVRQIFPVKDTSIEIKIQEFLKELKVDFIAHHYIDIPHRYLCDIFIPTLGLVIECDGNYWHQYPVGLPIDHIREKEIRERGWTIWRIWESVINNMTIREFENAMKHLIQTKSQEKVK